MEEYKEGSFFQTQNRQLAFALASAGCEFAPQSAGGPAINTYTLGFLRSRRIGVGKTIDAAAKEAADRKIPGIVSYIFKRTPKLEEAIAHWDRIVDEFRRAEAEERAPRGEDLTLKQQVEAAYYFAHNSKEFANVPWFNSPLISTIEASTSEVKTAGPDPKKVTRGKGKIWSLGASEEFKNQLRKRP